MVGVLLILPALASAQEATLSGTVVDSTGGVLPGATITAVHEASGNTFEGVTDERGVYRIARPRRACTASRWPCPGSGRSTARASSCSWGSRSCVNVQLSPADGAGIDHRHRRRRRCSTSPRRAWAATSTRGRRRSCRSTDATGWRSRRWRPACAPTPRTSGRRPASGWGTASSSSTSTARKSRSPRAATAASLDSAVTRSENSSSSRAASTQRRGARPASRSTPSRNRAPMSSAGSFSGYFRDDNFNAADFLAGTVLPYSNQQLSGTYGGPILRDRLHYFANYEYEREPGTQTFNTPVSELQHPAHGHASYGHGWAARRLSVLAAHPPDDAGQRVQLQNPYEAQQTGQQIGGHPASTESFKRHSEEVFATLTQVVSDRMLNEVRVGFNSHYYQHRQLHVASRSSAGGRGHRRRPSAHHVPRLPDRRQRPDAAEQQRERLPASRRHDALVQPRRAA